VRSFRSAPGYADPVLATERAGQPRYILVTQCLQNDFFLNPDCRLGLPDYVVREMLLGTSRLEIHAKARGVQELNQSDLESGPLGCLLALTIDERARGVGDHTGILHVINIRDWHNCTSRNYEDERRIYGRHCEEKTWGAGYIHGLAHFFDPHLKPGAPAPKAKATYFAAGSVRVYHVHSDTLFDFKPQAGMSGRRQFRASELEDYLDVIVEGSDKELDDLHDELVQGCPPERLHECVSKAMETKELDLPPVHVAAIGVYTDIKVKTLLTGLRTRYELNMAVSDTFTTSPTLERHLAGLDYAKKVLGVDVIHGINDLVHFLGGSHEVEDETSLVAAASYGSYERFFQDQQNVLAHQDQRLQEYVTLTQPRALRLYETINWANRFLLYCGGAFLGASLVLMFLSGILPDRFDWKLGAATGGLGVAQLVTIFFTRPMADLYQNLSNLAGFKMVLESHAMKTAIMRFHLTTARTLRPIETDELKNAALRQMAVLNRQLTVIGKADEADFAHLQALGFHELKDMAASDGRKNGGRVDRARKAPPAPDVSGGASAAKAD
jgi:hypothetical protein